MRPFPWRSDEMYDTYTWKPRLVGSCQCVSLHTQLDIYNQNWSLRIYWLYVVHNGWWILCQEVQTHLSFFALWYFPMALANGFSMPLWVMYVYLSIRVYNFHVVSSPKLYSIDMSTGLWRELSYVIIPSEPSKRIFTIW